MNTYKPDCRKVRVDTLLGCYMLFTCFNSIPHTQTFVNYFFILFLPEGSAGRLPAVTCAAALDVHMLCYAFIIIIIHTFHGITIDADDLAWVLQRAGIGIPSLSSLGKALTAGIIRTAGMLPAHHNIALAAKSLLIIGTVFHPTL